MESFLKLVAADLYKHTEGNLAHTAVVFPNKRAGLFFNEYLAQESESPIWSPAYVSISELFHRFESAHLLTLQQLLEDPRIHKLQRNG